MTKIKSRGYELFQSIQKFAEDEEKKYEPAPFDDECDQHPSSFNAEEEDAYNRVTQIIILSENTKWLDKTLLLHLFLPPPDGQEMFKEENGFLI